MQDRQWERVKKREKNKSDGGKKDTHSVVLCAGRWRPIPPPSPSPRTTKPRPLPPERELAA